MRPTHFLATVLLGAVLLQGLGQTGLLKYLYGQRHAIAYSLHLTDEKVISECGTRYLAEGTLVIQTTDETAALPSVYSASSLYTLFVPAEACVLAQPETSPVKPTVTPYLLHGYSSTVPQVFHPPLV